MYTHILIPTDGSDFAQKGVEHGLALAKALGSKVTIITASEVLVTPKMMGDFGSVTVTSELDRLKSVFKAQGDEVLLKARSGAEKLGLPVDTIYVSDIKPADAIIETAREQGCDLIVMASHGRRGIQRLILGSQTAEVVATSSIPVLVVR